MTQYSNKIIADITAYASQAAFWQLTPLYDDLFNAAWTGGANPYVYDTSPAAISGANGPLQFTGTPTVVAGPFIAFANAVALPASGYLSPVNPTSIAWYTFGYFGPFSVEFMMKTSVTTGIQTVVAMDNTNRKFKVIIASSHVDLTVYDNGGAANAILGTVNVADGNWHHVVCTYDYNTPSTLAIYVDGVLDTSSTFSLFNTAYGTSDFRMGSSATGTPDYFQGSLSGVSLWDGFLLTPAMVYSHYLAAIATFFPMGPVTSRTVESADLTTVAQDIFDFVISETITSIDSVVVSGGAISLSTTSQTVSTFTLPTAELSDNLPIDMSFYMAGDIITGPVA